MFNMNKRSATDLQPAARHVDESKPRKVYIDQ